MAVSGFQDVLAVAGLILAVVLWGFDRVLEFIMWKFPGNKYNRFYMW